MVFNRLINLINRLELYFYSNRLINLIIIRLELYFRRFTLSTTLASRNCIDAMRDCFKWAFQPFQKIGNYLSPNSRSKLRVGADHNGAEYQLVLDRLKDISSLKGHIVTEYDISAKHHQSKDIHQASNATKTKSRRPSIVYHSQHSSPSTTKVKSISKSTSSSNLKSTLQKAMKSSPFMKKRKSN